MGSKKEFIQNSSLEAFVEEFSDFFTSFDRIEFSRWIDDTQTKNGVEFRILDKFIITFTRSTAYLQYVIKYQDTTLYSGSYVFSASSSNKNYQCYCRVSTNKRVVNIRFFNYSTGENIDKDILFIITDDNNPIVGMIYQNNNVPCLSHTNSKFLDTSGEHSYNILARCVYFNSSEKDDIEIIMNKAVCEGSFKVDTTSGLYDCSTVSPDTVYMFDNQRYYAIDANTLMPV